MYLNRSFAAQKPPTTHLTTTTSFTTNTKLQLFHSRRTICTIWNPSIHDDDVGIRVVVNELPSEPTESHTQGIKKPNAQYLREYRDIPYGCVFQDIIISFSE